MSYLPFHAWGLALGFPVGGPKKTTHGARVETEGSIQQMHGRQYLKPGDRFPVRAGLEFFGVKERQVLCPGGLGQEEVLVFYWCEVRSSFHEGIVDAAPS